MVAIDEVGEPGGAAGEGDDGVEVMLIHDGVDAFGASEAMIFLESVEIFFVGEGAAGFGLSEKILAEVEEFFFAIVFVEGDDFFESANWSVIGGEVGVEIVFEFVEEDFVFGVVELGGGGNFDVDESGAFVLHDIKSGGAEGRGGLGDVEGVAKDADAGAAEAGAIEELSVVVVRLALADLGGGVVRIDGGDGGEDRGAVGDSAADGAGGVLGVGDGNDAGARDEAEGGLDADESIGVGRADDGAVGLGADGGGAEIGGSGGAGAGT